MIDSWSRRSPKALLASSCASASWRSQTSPNDLPRRSRAAGSSPSISAAPSTTPDTRRSFRPGGARDCRDGGRRCSPSCTTTPSARERSSRSPALRSWRSASNSRFEPGGRPLHADRMRRRSAASAGEHCPLRWLREPRRRGRGDNRPRQGQRNQRSASPRSRAPGRPSRRRSRGSGSAVRRSCMKDSPTTDRPLRR